jgi:serine/threonine protein kinase
MSTSADTSRFHRHQLRAAVDQQFSAGGQVYRLAGVVSQGVVGVIRKARAVATGELVAVKFFAPQARYLEILSFQTLYMQFYNEGTYGQQLAHPQLARILAFEENRDGRAFIVAGGPVNPLIVMEWVPGKSLAQRLRTASPAPRFDVTRQTLTIALQIAQVLNYLHQHSVIHCDVRPENIVIKTDSPAPGQVSAKLVDLGLACWTQAAPGAADAAHQVHQPPALWTHYMAPEMKDVDRPIEALADTYGLGLTFLELFTHARVTDLAAMHRAADEVRAGRYGPAASLYDLGVRIVSERYNSLFALIYAMLDSDPARRPASEHILSLLQRLLERL